MQSGLYLLICNSEIKTTRHAHVCVSVCLDVRIHVPPSSLKCTAAQFQLAWSYDRPLQKSGGLEPNSIAIHANGILPPTLVLVQKKTVAITRAAIVAVASWRFAVPTRFETHRIEGAHSTPAVLPMPELQL